MTDQYKKVPGTEDNAGSVGGWLKLYDEGSYHTLVVRIANAISAALTGDLPDTAPGDLAAINAALAGTLTTENAQYTTVATGEIQGSATAAVCPTVACKLVKFKARQDNAGFVYLGISGVTKPDGTTDTTTGFELDASEETGWIPVDNLNRFYRICDNAGDDLTYMALT